MNKRLAQQWLHIEGLSLAHYHRLLAHTVRWRIEGQANVTQAYASGRPLLWAFWHGQISAFVTYAVRFIGGNRFCLVTLGGDDRGDILATFAAELGATPFGVDMQGNPMAAGRAVLRVIQAMKGGQQSFLAPDGPDGPPFVPKAGVAYLARKAEAAVIPVGGFTPFGYQLKRWDNYLVPYPLAPLHIVFGQPILVNARDEEQMIQAEIAQALTAVYTRARIRTPDEQ
jgi:lysophospholipid acyltransferase (LPLAT)-like uncharacterized protein